MTFEERLDKGKKLIAEDKYLEAFDIYCELNYEKPEDLSLLEKALFLMDRITEANYDFQPQTAIQYLFRGVAKYYKGEFRNSMNDYDKAIELDSNLVNAYYFKAISHRDLGEK